ncbi:MAG: hypothetical protein AABX38_02010 [Candidatus Micrarchaeota archaeon]
MTAHAFHYKVNEGERIVQAGKVRSTLRSSIEGGNAIVHYLCSQRRANALELISKNPFTLPETKALAERARAMI